jgi:hypothetical protein
MLIMHYGEEPGANIGAVLPQMRLGNRAEKSVLDKIIRPIGLPRQGPRIAAKSRDLMFDEAVKLRHCGDS